MRDRDDRRTAPIGGKRNFAPEEVALIALFCDSASATQGRVRAPEGTGKTHRCPETFASLVAGRRSWSCRSCCWRQSHAFTGSHQAPLLKPPIAVDRRQEPLREKPGVITLAGYPRRTPTLHDVQPTSAAGWRAVGISWRKDGYAVASTARRTGGEPVTMTQKIAKHTWSPAE